MFTILLYFIICHKCKALDIKQYIVYTYNEGKRKVNPQGGDMALIFNGIKYAIAIFIP